MTKDEVIANAKAQGASEEELQILRNTPDSEYGNVPSVGKTSDITSTDANVMSSSTASESTGLNLEPGSSDSIKDTVDESPPPSEGGDIYGSSPYQIIDDNGNIKNVSPEEYLKVYTDEQKMVDDFVDARNRVKNQYYVDASFFEGKVNETKLREQLNVKLKPLNVKIKEVMPGFDALEFTYKDGTVEEISFDDWGIINYGAGKGGNVNRGQGALTNEERANFINDIIDSQIDYLSNPDSPGYSENFDWGIYSGAMNMMGVGAGNAKHRALINENAMLNLQYDYEDMMTQAVVNGDWKAMLESGDLTSDELIRVKNAKYLDLMGMVMDSDRYKTAMAQVEVTLNELKGSLLKEVFNEYNPEPIYDQNGVLTGFKDDENWVAGAAAIYEKRFKDLREDVINGNSELRKIIGSIDYAVNSVFNPVIQDVSAYEGRIDRYGEFVGSRDFLSNIWKFIDLKAPMQLKQFNALNNSQQKSLLLEQKNSFADWQSGKGDNVFRNWMGAEYNIATKLDPTIHLIEEQTDVLDEYDKFQWDYTTSGMPLNRRYNFDREQIEKQGYVDIPVWFAEMPTGDYLDKYKILGKADPRNENAMFGEEGTGFMMNVRFDNLEDAYKEINNQYKLVEIALDMEIIEDLMKAKDFQNTLGELTYSNSALYDENGNWNVTVDNWQAALGDTGMTMLASIFSGGMYTFLAESGGFYMEALEQAGIEEFGDEWNNMSLEKKKKELNRLIDTRPEIMDNAFTVGGVNMMLDNVSNLFFVGKVGKPVIQNLPKAWGLFIRGNAKAAVQNLGLKSGIKNVSTASLVEAIIESMQEENTQYHLGNTIETYQHSFNGTINSGVTALLTTPVFLGVGSTMTSFTGAVYNKVTAMNAEPGKIIEFCDNQRKALYDARANNKITQEAFAERIQLVDAVQETFAGLGKENGGYTADRIWSDKQIIKEVFETQAAIEQDKIQLQNLNQQKQKAKKRLRF